MALQAKFIFILFLFSIFVPRVAWGQNDCQAVLKQARQNTTVLGKRIEYYQGLPPASAESIKRVIIAFSSNRIFRNLNNFVVIIGANGCPLNVIPELESSGIPQDAEGVAPVEGTIFPNPVVVIRPESLARWDLGIAHETIHVIHHHLPMDAKTEIRQVFDSMVKHNGPRDQDSNEYELLAYMGQWILGGYGDLVQTRIPWALPLVTKYVGTFYLQKPTVDPGQLGTFLDRLNYYFVEGHMPNVFQNPFERSL